MIVWVSAALCIVLSGCSPKALVIEGIANQLAGQSAVPEEDLGILRESSAFYLKVSESVLRQSPGHLRLAEAVAGGFTQYAYAFVSLDAEKLEATDPAGAFAQRKRAGRLYLRGLKHAMTALETRTPGFRAALAQPNHARWPKIDRETVGIAYWAAAAWGAYIALANEDVEAVADLPLAARLAELAAATDPEYGQGALLSLLGRFESARPGGSPTKAMQLFDRAIAVAQGRDAGVLLAKAEGAALPAGDRDAFVMLLRAAQQAAQAHPTAANDALGARARWLLDHTDDLF